MSFYQTYRPKKIAELDLVSVRESLQAAMSGGMISHAYLFVGPRGSGKTSAARILAQTVNCEENRDKKTALSEPCGKCNACVSLASGSSVDVLEIDAASSGLVDDIRDLREKVRLAPVQLTKKVYIIDEVHMVSLSGFNALLKTLEEPPKHVIFILCTTEGQKVPETIASRCLRVNFIKASTQEVIDSLMKAVKGEGLNITEEALVELAEATDGSFREGHKLLEQVASFGKKIDRDLVLKVLGVVSRQSVIKILEAVEERDSKRIVKIFNEMDKSGVKAANLATVLISEVKGLLERKIDKNELVEKEITLIDKLILASEKVKISPSPLLPLEIALLSIAIEEKNGVENHIKAEKSPESGDRVSNNLNHSLKSTINKDKIEEKDNKIIQNYDGPLVSLDKIKTEWMEFLNVMSGSCGSLAGMLRLVSPVDVKGKSLTLSVTSRFQQDMLERDVKKKLIEEQMAKIWGPMTFRCVLNEKDPERTRPDLLDENIEPIDKKMTVEDGIAEVAEKIFGS